MLYFDTSFLAPLIIPELSSREVSTFMQRLSEQQRTVSHWNRVEFSSILARRVRTGELDAKGAMRADTQFEAMLEANFDVVLPGSDDFDLAKQYLARFETGLRSGDALHLAIGANRRARVIYSLDKGLVKAAKILGLPAETGIAV